MENATKALLIAAAVLVAIILIAIGVKIFSSTGGSVASAEKTGDAISGALSSAASSIRSSLGKAGGGSTGETAGTTPGETGMTLEQIKQAIQNDPDKYLQQAKELGQTSESHIFIDSEGNVINYDTSIIGQYTPEGLIISLSNVKIKENQTLLKLPAYEYIINEEKWEAFVGIDNSIQSSMNNEFKNKIKEIVIPDTYKTIGQSAFEGCVALETINIPNSVTGEIGIRAFYNCKKLKNIIIPNSVTLMGKWCFDGCTNLESVILPENLQEIPEEMFSGCESLKEISIPNSVKSIGGFAFYGCKTLKEITIPNSVETIGKNGTFNYCDNLKTIYIDRSKSSPLADEPWSAKNAEIIYLRN